MTAQVTNLLTNQNQIAGRAFVDAALARDNLRLHLRWRVIELDSDETLPGGLLQVFENRLIAGIIRDDQHEIRGRFQDGPALFNGQPTAVIGQWMNDDDGVFARFDYFVEVADGAVAHRGGQGTIVPDCLFAFEQKTSHQIGGRKILVAGDSD